MRLGYSRTAVANAEAGSVGIGRQFWERADRVLKAGELFARGYDRIQAQLAAETRAHAARPAPAVVAADQAGEPSGLESPAASEARQACADRGWPAELDLDGTVWLMTGTVIDALEVPRPAGVLAVHWWLYTRGVPDEIRGLPALPDPASALAAITAGERCYFLTQAGACPWSRPESVTASPAGFPAVVVRWHAQGGRVPAPPSRLGGGEPLRWAHAPSGGGQLVSPMALLHVLAQAITATQEDGSVLLPGGVRAVPAADVRSV